MAQHQHAQQPDPQNPEGENGKPPPTWKIRLDRPNPDAVIGAEEGADIFFVNMTPGWHITTDPAAIFYHPASTAAGAYRAETTIHLFDPKGRNEAFGLFLGGRNLDGADVSYDYFLIRNNGQFLIKRRTGGETSVIQAWTPSEAVMTFGADSGSSIANTLAVDVGEEVVFSINDTEVVRLPRAAVQTDGVVGLRINHALNVHVSDLSVKGM
jgi:hypothetical protein